MPYAGGHRLRRAIRALRREYERQIRALDDALAPSAHSQEADDIAEVCRCLCGAMDVPAGRSMHTLDGCRDRLCVYPDHSEDCGTALLIAQAMFEAIRADDAVF